MTWKYLDQTRLMQWLVLWWTPHNYYLFYFVQFYFKNSNIYWLHSFRSTASNCSISVRFVLTYCAIIVNQSYTKDFLNSPFKARHSNFQTFDKVNDDLYKRCLLLLYFILKTRSANQKLRLCKKTKSTGFARTFWTFDSRRLLLLKIVQMRWVM